MKKISITFLSLSIALFSLHNCAVFNSISTASQSLDSVSTSLNSISRSLNSISKSVMSISVSSSGGEEKEKTALYNKDVKTLVSLYSRDANRMEDLESDIARIAEKNGVLNWQEYRGTYSSIGSGLKSAGYSLEEVQEISRLSCPGKEELQTAILEGYRS